MGSAPLIQLFEQAVERSTELADRAGKAEDEAEQVLQGATALTDLALQHADGLHKDYAEALQAIATAREQVDIEASRADVALDGLPARADATEAKVRALLEDVRQQATELAGVRTRLVTRADESAQQVSAAFGDLAQRVQDLRQKMEARLVEADVQVKELVEAVKQGQTRLAEEARLLREAIQSMGILATDKAEDFAASMHAVMILAGRNVVNLCNEALKSHNAAFKSVRTGFTGEDPGGAGGENWVEEALKPLRASLDAFALIPQPAKQLIEQSAAAIAQKAEKALADLADVGKALEQAVPEAPGL
jgi:hypothetical protein